MRSILAVDPGLTSGVAFYTGGDPRPIQSELTVDQFFDYAQDLFTGFYAGTFAVVCESFTITGATAKKTQAPWSLELIGVLKYLCHVHEVSFTLQPPAIKRFVSNDKIRAADWWKPGTAGHAQDAIRHLVFFAVKHGVPVPSEFTQKEGS